ncbi:MGDG synthase family glycosyltransferase [Crassaminicella profunda]|uniref:MGDG synthase family glycosyltransferase n=1 Tax=Crassaminicella profunda TaxID=1286698 RepID=UPI001CA6C053|nr:glycosyltransferase [Crassaminicella profunda]QZY56389.1 glycosyltransferase [Crassaminicella profunda]
MKKLLIFTASTGGGHNQAAGSLEELFEANGYDVVILDALKEANKVINCIITDGYELLVKRLPKAYRELYRKSDGKKINLGMVHVITKLMEEKIYHLIQENQPDIIIATHPFVVNIIGELKRKGKISIPFMSIVTDYKAHQTYIHEKVDAYITGSDYTKIGMIKKGVKEERIFPYGIPIRKEFFICSIDKKKNKEDIFTLLLMGGSMGLKAMEKVLKNIMSSNNKIKIITVCGNNKKLKKKIEKKYQGKFKNKEVFVYGFTKNIPELMEISDVIITKPGGLTVSEAIVKNIPMIIPYVIPGQEEENADFLVQSGVALRAKKIKHIADTIDGLIEKPQELTNMKRKLKDLSKMYDRGSIVQLADELIRKYSNKINDNKKEHVLVLTANFGSGHVTVAKAIKEQLAVYNNRLNIKVIDIFEILSPHLNNELYKGYEVLIKKTHNIYNYFYRKKSNKEIGMDKIIYKIYLSKIAKYIQKLNPKFIVSTFPVCSGFVSMYKGKYKSTLPLITCMTDVVDHCEWIYPNTDKYLVPTNKIKEQFIYKGIHKDKIYVTGIPVRKDFLDKYENEKIRRTLNIKDSEFVLLMMGGGLGLLPKDKELYEWLDSLENVKTIIVTGTNKKQYRDLVQNLNLKNTIVKGFTNEVAGLMKHADLLITKAGGVSIFEAIHSELPMIVYEPILAQEIENGKFIENSGIGEIIKNTKELKEKVNTFIKNREKRTQLKMNIKRIKQQSDSREFIDCISEIYGEDLKKEKIILKRKMI